MSVLDEDLFENMEYVGETVQGFANMKYVSISEGERKKEGKKTYSESILPILLTTNLIKSEYTEQLSFKDVICMIDDVKTNLDYGGSVKEQKSWFSYECRYLSYALLSAYNAVIPLHLFLDLPVKSFYRYLEETAENPNEMRKEFYRAGYNFVCIYNDAGKKYTADTTIKDVLETIQYVGLKQWFPESMSLSRFKKQAYRVIRCYEDILIKSFKTAWTSEIDIEKLRARAIIVTDDWDDEPDEAELETETELRLRPDLKGEEDG